MRCAAVLFVLVMLLPTPIMFGDRPRIAAPNPLALFGGDGEVRDERAPALVAEVYYNALRADEYVVVENMADTLLDLTGWTLTDNEGTLTFPSNSTAALGRRVVVAQNATAYREDTRRPADFQYGGGDATAMHVSGTFRLNDTGDEVLLRDAFGVLVDALAYGDSAYAGEGWSGPPAQAVGQGQVARRNQVGSSASDGDDAADWDLVRVWSLGQSEFAPASFAFTGSVAAFVSPDDSLEPVRFLLADAKRTIDVSVYTLTSDALGRELRGALRRGVRVRVLLEGGPVGGIPADEWEILQGLAAEGAQVRFLIDNTSLDVQERYRYVHTKYAVLDGETVLVSSENWGHSGFPARGLRGSRGWSMAVAHAPLAAYFTEVFQDDVDASRRDIRSIAELAVTPSTPKRPASGTYGSRFTPRTVSGFLRVVPVVGPDTTLAQETILGAIRGATATVHAELFYAHRDWGPFPNGYLDALLSAARRGVEVRLLLDAASFNADEDDPKDNDDTAAFLNGMATAEGLDLQAKLVALEPHGFTELHNKGFVVDGSTVLVSSVNWNRNSPTANREAGLLVENPEVAGYFDEAFAWDWKDDVTTPVADAGPDRTVDVGARVAFSGIGSTDDVALVNYSWDLDGDATFDHWGPEVDHSYPREGRFAIRLRVADAWNNAAEDAAIVTVREPDVADADPRPSIGAAAVAVGTALLWFASVRRRRKGISKPPRL